MQMMDITVHSQPRRIFDATGPEDRLDRFVEARCPELSRSRCARLIREGWVLLNGGAAKPSTHVRAGDAVQVVVPPSAPSEMAPQPMHLPIVYQDSHIIVVNKPAGLTVHPGPGHPDWTLVNALLAMVPDLPGVGGVQRPGIVHRLDKETSGLMVVAKTDVAHAGLTRQLKERQVDKVYLALASGKVAGEEGEIDAPIGRHPRRRQRMAVVPTGRSAVTRFRVVSRFSDCTLVEAYPVTGRTHQVRVHLAHLGHPLVGDKVYGKASDLIGRQFLHAARLGFYVPPEEREWRVFEAPLSADLRDALAVLRLG